MSHESKAKADVMQRLDYLCDQFESAWQAGNIPSLADYLVAVEESSRKELFRELLHLELTYRSRTSQIVTQSDYDSRFPNYSDIVAEEFAKLSVSRTIGFQDADTECEVPENFGDYEFKEMIARGGMGIVYKARQKSLNRVVALKMVLAGEFASNEMTERFQTEAELAAGLNHPNIVPIYDFGHQDGRSFISMGFIEGTSLDAVISKSCFPPKIAARIVLTCARAIEYAHSKGVIHRDIKPQNILINEYREPVITDFGLAKTIESDQEMTATGQVLGTANYMPPEQAAGVRDSVGPLADVYSLGATLYHMLVGRAPFESDGFIKTLKNVIEAEPQPLRAINPDVPSDLETICLKCLEKNPARRYQSARELAEDLSNWLADEPIIARPASTLERAARWISNRRSVVVLSILLVISVFTGLFSSYYFAHRTSNPDLDSSNQAAAVSGAKSAPQPKTIRTAVEKTANANIKPNTPIVAIKPRNWATMEIERLQQELTSAVRKHATLMKLKRVRERTINAENLKLAKQAYRVNDLVEAKRRLNLIPADVRFQKWHELDRRCRPAKAMAAKGRVVGLKLSTDATRLFVKTQSQLIAYDIASERPIWKANVPGSTLDYCAKTDELLAGDSLYEASTGKVVTKRTGKNVRLLGMNAHGTRVAAMENNQLRVFSLSATNRSLTRPRDISNRFAARHVQFTDDGSRLIGHSGTSVAVWDLSNRRAKSTPLIYRVFARSVAVMPVGSTLCIGVSDNWSANSTADNVQLLRTEVYQQSALSTTNGFVLPDPPLNALTGKPGVRDVTAIALSADRKFVVFAQMGNLAHVLPVAELTRKPWPDKVTPRRKIPGTSNGYQMVYPGTPYRLEGQIVRMGKRVSPINAIVLMPKGDMLIAGRMNGQVEFWPINPPSVIKRPPTKLPPGAATFALASPGLGSLRHSPRGLQSSAAVRINGSKTPVMFSEGQLHRIPASFPGLGQANGASFLFDVRGTRAAIHQGKKIEIWDLKLGKQTHSFDTTGTSTGVQLSEDGRFVVLLMMQGLRVWDIDNKRLVISNSDLKFHGKNEHLGGLCSSIDKSSRRLAVSTAKSQNITVFDLTTGKLLYQKKSPGYALLTTKTLIVSSNFNGDHTLSLFDAESGKAIGSSISTDLSFSDPPPFLIDPQEKWMVYGKKDALVKVDLATGNELLSVKTSNLFPFSLAPDGKTFLSIAKQGIVLIDSATLQPLAGPVAGTLAQFSRDGRRIIALTELKNSNTFRFLSPGLKELPAHPKLPNF